MGTTFWIHNDGDTTLVLSDLTVDGGFALSGYTPNEQILPGDSAPVVVTFASVPGGTNIGSLLAVGADTACTMAQTAPVQVIATSFAVAGTNHDFGNVYVCRNDSAVVTAKSLGTIPAVLDSVQIVDALSSNGANQFTFTNGTHGLTLGDTLNLNGSVNFTVMFNPQIAGGTGAYLRYTFTNLETGMDTSFLEQLSGAPLHYVNTLSLASGATGGLYTAHPSESVTVPISFGSGLGGLNMQSGIYRIRFILRYKRDMFISGTPQGNNASGLRVIQNNSGPDPSDANFVLNTVVVQSNSPITEGDSSIASVTLEYVVNKDSISTLDIIDPVYEDSTGNPVCWVSHDTIPATFAGLDRCGDLTLRNLLSGGTPTFRIESITPNPTRGDATVAYSVRLNGVPLTMDIYDALGQRDLTLMWQNPILTGEHSATLQTTALPSGSYILRVSDGATEQSVPFVVQK